MAEGREEGIIVTEQIDKPLEEKGAAAGPTSIDVTDEQISIGPTSIDVTDELPSTVATSSTEQQEEKVQEQNREIEQAQEKTRISKRNQKRRITSYLSGTSKQVEKQGNQINKLMMTIQSLQKQKPKQIKSTKKDQLQLKTIHQIKSQVNQLQKQVSQIQNDVRRIRSASMSGTGVTTRTKIRKSTSSVTPRVKLSAKKSKSHKNAKFKRSRSSRPRMK